MEHLTPELVLVDPEFAARVRAELADPPDCLEVPPPVVPRPLPVGAERIQARRPARSVGRHRRPLDDPPRARPVLASDPVRVPTAPGPIVDARGSEPARRRRRPRLATLARGGTWAVVVLFLLSPLLAFVPASSTQLPRLAAPTSAAATPTSDPSETQAPAESAPPRVTVATPTRTAPAAAPGTDTNPTSPG